MSTEKLFTTAFIDQVSRTWLTKIGHAAYPNELPTVTELDAKGPPLVIGRDTGPRTGVYLIDDRSVSAQHAELRSRNGYFEVTDLGSKNGTSVNGEPIATQTPQPLRDGDFIQIAGTFLRFRRGDFSSHSIPESPTENECTHRRANDRRRY